MKYTIQELLDKQINIYCPTKEKFNRVIEYLKSNGVKSFFKKFDDFYDKENTCVKICVNYDGSLYTQWDDVKRVSKFITVEEFFEEDVGPTSDCCSVEAPSVINEATAAFDRFLKEWNALHKKAMKIKSIKSLDSLTNKIKEL